MDRKYYSTWMMTTRSANSVSSWEERAFAEDAAGALGGACVWPPRSYSCSFCKREFRSPQALGGHMNVHRRDRARLKLASSSSQDEHIVSEHRQIFSQKSLDVTPNTVLTSTTSLPRVSDFVTKRNCPILDDREGDTGCAKRPKITVATLQFFVSKEGLCKGSSMEELDLELRLGSNPPKIVRSNHRYCVTHADAPEVLLYQGSSADDH